MSHLADTKPLNLYFNLILKAFFSGLMYLFHQQAVRYQLVVKPTHRPNL